MHDFTAVSFFGNSTIVAGAAPQGEIELKPYETRSITLIPRAGSYSAHWLQAKVIFVLGLSALHGIFVGWVRDFAHDRNRRPQRFYRLVNEVPTALMIVVVVLAVVKPF